MTSRLRGVWEYLRFGIEFFVLRPDRPYILGLVTNDTCNLRCLHCRVANVARFNMSLGQIEGILERHYRNGMRFLYIEGGEPYLWHDGRYRLKDIVRLAHAIGYLRVHVYTNGTVTLDARPDFTWVSIDGLDESFRRIRGIPLGRVVRNVREFKGRWGVVFVVNTFNYREIARFLAYIDGQFPGIPVMFYFHTPYYGVDELRLSPGQKHEAVDSLIACKKAGLPVLNSRVALKAYLAGNKGLPVNDWWVVDQQGEYRCCRVNGRPEICKECGYSTCNEVVQARAWHPGAIWGLLKAL